MNEYENRHFLRQTVYYNAYKADSPWGIPIELDIFNVDYSDYSTVGKKRVKNALINEFLLKNDGIQQLIGHSVGKNHVNKLVLVKEFRGEKLLVDALDDMNITQKMDVIKCIASAMRYIHSKHILHRDLSTSTVIIDDCRKAFLVDIGYSHVFQSLYTMAKIKKLERYTPPEVITKNEFDMYSDVYTFGVLMYEVFSNSKILDDENQFQMMNTIMNGFKLPTLEAVPKEVNNIISACCSKKELRPSFVEICNLLGID